MELVQLDREISEAARMGNKECVQNFGGDNIF
jgi:hypothetical protein